MNTTCVTKLNIHARPVGLKLASLPFMLAALSMIGPFSIDTYLPSLPSISQGLGASASAVQQTMTIFMAFFAFMSLWHGSISDAYGRRRLTIISVVVFSVASLGCALANSIHVLLFFRALQGATAGAGMIVGKAVVRDIYDGAAAQKLMSHIASILTIAPVLAPVLGGLLQTWFGWRAVFVFLTTMSVLVALGCLRAMPETLPRDKRQRLKPVFMARSYYKVLTMPAFMFSCCSMALFMSGFFLYIMSAPQFLMTHLNLHETEFLWLFGPIGIGMVTGAWFSGHVAGKISGKQTVYIGFLVMTIAAVFNVLLNLLLPPMLPWSILPLVLYAVGMSIAMPSMTLMGMDLLPAQRGLAASVQGFIMLGANAVVPALVPMVWDSTLSMALTELALLTGALLTLFLYFWSMKKRVSRPAKQHAVLTTGEVIPGYESKEIQKAA